MLTHQNSKIPKPTISASYHNSSSENFSADKYVSLNGAGISTNKLKAGADILIATITCIAIFSWLFPIIGLIIKLTSKGPIFFVQDRVGLNNKIFKCYKFRTMYLNTTKNTFTPIVKGDNRITKIGSFLRKTNLDEIPQIMNVLKGEMSIVGPRPHAVAFHLKYATFIPNINDRHLVKPGITGWAQIKGYRGDVLDDELNKLKTIKRIRYDLAYIQKWSFVLDCKIIAITFFQMITRKTNGV